MRVLVVRNDRIGDLVLATPVISTIRANYNDAYIGVLVSKYAEDVVRSNPDVNTVITDESVIEKKSFRSFLTLFRRIKSEKFNAAIVLFPSFIVCFLIFLAGIRKRISHGSRWYVYLFCNEILLQHRSRVEKHEADYNLALVERLGNLRIIERKTKIFTDSKSLQKARNLLKNKGVNDNFIIMHCGSGGSARNWSALKYAQLADMLIEKLMFNLVFTGSDRDYTMIAEVRRLMKNKAIEILDCEKLSDLIALISLAQIFIGPSTGPLHIASSLNVPVLGIYSPVTVQSKKRWGPYNHEKAIVLTPEVECPAHYRCLYQKCQYYDCMESISADEAFFNITELLNRKQNEH
jgi:lipopolysaccharide heptosyltransferase II